MKYNKIGIYLYLFYVLRKIQAHFPNKTFLDIYVTFENI